MQLARYIINGVQLVVEPLAPRTFRNVQFSGKVEIYRDSSFKCNWDGRENKDWWKKIRDWIICPRYIKNGTRYLYINFVLKNHSSDSSYFPKELWSGREWVKYSKLVAINWTLIHFDYRYVLNRTLNILKWSLFNFISRTISFRGCSKFIETQF